jgi:hypothetical protein
MALVGRSRFRVSRLPLEILSERDQNKLGILAATILLVESRELSEERVEQPTNPFPDCCEVARMHHLPCVHRMRELEDQCPRITIHDVPIGWRRVELERPTHISHASNSMPDSHGRQPDVGRLTFSQFIGELEHYRSIVERSPQCLRIMSDCLASHHSVIR